MAITNITAEFDELRAYKELDTDIDALSEAQAQFCLRALLAAGHISADIVRKSIALAETIRIN